MRRALPANVIRKGVSVIQERDKVSVISQVKSSDSLQ